MIRILTLVAILGCALFFGAPRVAAQQRGVKIETLKSYLDKMGLQSVPHPKNSSALVVPRSNNEFADRVDMYVETREDRSVVLTAYPRLGGRYFNLSRAVDREKLLLQLVEANHRSFATFFADPQGDIGMRFTFTTEDGIGFDSFRAAANELLRVADQYTPKLDEQMKKEAPPSKPGSAGASANEPLTAMVNADEKKNLSGFAPGLANTLSCSGLCATTC